MQLPHQACVNSVINNHEFQPVNFKAWLSANNIPPSLADKLKKQTITTIEDLELLTEQNIVDLKLTIGENNRLKVALNALRRTI